MRQMRRMQTLGGHWPGFACTFLRIQVRSVAAHRQCHDKQDGPAARQTASDEGNRGPGTQSLVQLFPASGLVRCFEILARAPKAMRRVVYSASWHLQYRHSRHARSHGANGVRTRRNGRSPARRPQLMLVAQLPPCRSLSPAQSRGFGAS
jgi:hypothetical protein